MGDIRLRRLTGTVLHDRLPALAALRIAVFREYPYLYAGSVAYEERYMSSFDSIPGSVIIGAFDGDQLVGAATGVPLADESDALREPFLHDGWNPHRIFYFGEFVLLADYRSQGLGSAFFHHGEALARVAGRFDHTAFCEVIRSADHPRRPTAYRPLDDYWRRQGYEAAERVVATLSWRDLDDAVETAKPMQFWMKAL